MSEEEKKKPQPHETPQPLSRREFAIGSVAILGACSFAKAATPLPLSAEAQALKLEIADDVKNLLYARHIIDDDLKRVIDHAEKTGEKLYQPESDRLLSKLRVQEAYFYVEYSPTTNGYRIHTAYTHRFLLAGDQ
jgi:hypothetical protein